SGCGLLFAELADEALDDRRHHAGEDYANNDDPQGSEVLFVQEVFHGRRASRLNAWRGFNLSVASSARPSDPLAAPARFRVPTCGADLKPRQPCSSCDKTRHWPKTICPVFRRWD